MKVKTFAEKGFTVKVNTQQTSSSGGARPKQPKKPEDPAQRKEIERLMKGKCYRCGDSHQTDQCLQKDSSLKCTSCGRKGHIAKACYTDMLKKSGAIKTNTVQALALDNKLAMESWQVDVENGSGQMMPKGLGTWEVHTSFPLGLGNPYPTNKQTKLSRHLQSLANWQSRRKPLLCPRE